MAERNENIWTGLGESFTKELKTIVQSILKDSIKKPSDLEESVEFIPQRDSLYMYVSDYYQNVSKGRKPNVKKIPIQALILWMKKNGISPNRGMSLNQLAYIMQNAIYKNGIKGKNFIELIENSVTDVVEIRVADNLELFVADALFQSFQLNGKSLSV